MEVKEEKEAELIEGPMEGNLNLEDLERAYFGDRKSYYTQDQQASEFGHMVISENDFETIRAQVGEDLHQIQNLTFNSDEGLVRDEDQRQQINQSQMSTEDRQILLLSEKIM